MMTAQEYIDNFKNRFGNQTSKDGQLIRDMNDFEVLDRALRRYPGDRDEIDEIDLEAYYDTYDPSRKPPPPAPKTGVQKRIDELTGGLTAALKARRQAQEEALGRSIEGKQSLGSGLLQAAGEGAGFIGDVGFEAVKAITPEPIRQLAGGAVEAVAGLEPVQAGMEAYSGFKEKNPELAENIEAVGNIAGILPAAGGAVKGTQLAGKAAKAGAEATADAARAGTVAAREAVETAFTPTEAKVDRFITESFNKAVKPSVAGKKTLGQSDRYQNQALDAVKTIAANKDNLKFVTPDGDEVTGLPTNLRQFAESVDQTKKSIFEQYSELARRAGEEGAEIDLANVGNELDTVIANKALQISNPEAVAYAKSIKDRLTQGGKVDAETAEQLIKNYNSSLESFYRNPSYETASRAAIDAAVVNNIRKDLDTVIESLTGEQYQALKNQYAALKTIEKDVVKRANMEARKNATGLLDYADIFSGGDIVGGILSLNPALFAKGVAQKGITEYFKFLNDPNRAIKRMFERTQVPTRATQ